MVDQRTRDHGRRTYVLAIPPDTELQSILDLLQALSGTLKPSKLKIFGQPSIAFELWSNAEGITHRLKVNWQYADYVVQQLSAHIPGIGYEPDREPPRRQWTRAIELGLRHTS